MRLTNPNQTLKEFILLDHKPVQRIISPNTEIMECTECKSWMGSKYSCNPCGDPNGTTLTFFPQRFRYKGTILN